MVCSDALLPPNGPLVALRGVSKTFVVGGHRVAALRELHLQVQAGEFIAIMGASGSGKSTLLNIMGLLDRPTTGEHLFSGQKVEIMSADARARLRATVGFVFQSFVLLPRTSAAANVALPLLYRPPLSRADRHQRVAAALTRVGLSDRAAHTPAQLSGGQQQRVAIARALITQPRLLLADEPTGNLDGPTGRGIMHLLQQLHAAGQTTIMVTHEREIALHAGRIVTFRDGSLVQDERVQAPCVAVPAESV